jgi:hypothetical protein
MKKPREMLSNIWNNNGFGEVDEWKSLSRSNLLDECQDLLDHWVNEGWDMGETTAVDMANFLEKEWQQ